MRADSASALAGPLDTQPLDWRRTKIEWVDPQTRAEHSDSDVLSTAAVQRLRAFALGQYITPSTYARPPVPIRNLVLPGGAGKYLRTGQWFNMTSMGLETRDEWCYETWELDYDYASPDSNTTALPDILYQTNFTDQATFVSAKQNHVGLTTDSGQNYWIWRCLQDTACAATATSVLPDSLTDSSTQLLNRLSWLRSMRTMLKMWCSTALQYRQEELTEFVKSSIPTPFLLSAFAVNAKLNELWRLRFANLRARMIPSALKLDETVGFSQTATQLRVVFEYYGLNASLAGHGVRYPPIEIHESNYADKVYEFSQDLVRRGLLVDKPWNIGYDPQAPEFATQTIHVRHFAACKPTECTYKTKQYADPLTLFMMLLTMASAWNSVLIFLLGIIVPRIYRRSLFPPPTLSELRARHQAELDAQVRRAKKEEDVSPPAAAHAEPSGAFVHVHLAAGDEHSPSDSSPAPHALPGSAGSSLSVSSMHRRVPPVAESDVDSSSEREDAPLVKKAYPFDQGRF